jgi:hypothetical protein
MWLVSMNLKKAFVKIAIVAATILGTSAFVQAEEIRVPLDESTVFVFDQDVGTVAVSNPAIADVSVHNGRVLLVMGRSFGTTNVIILDKDGKAIGNKRIRVTSVGGWSNVTLVKGGQNGVISFSCAPRCERAIVPGDQSSTNAENDKVQEQNDARVKSATGSTD